MVLPIYAVLSKIEPESCEAARDLGANERQVFTKVIFRFRCGLSAGVIMVFIPAMVALSFRVCLAEISRCSLGMSLSSSFVLLATGILGQLFRLCF